MTLQNCAADSEKKFGDIYNTHAALSAVYPQLRRIAGRMLTRERRGHTFQPTSLVNEAVLRLLRREAAGEDQKRLVFFGIREMKTILIDSGRRTQTRLEYGRTEGVGSAVCERMAEMIHLQLCLEKLGEVDARSREVVELRFYAGLTIHEVADFLEVSSRTVNEDWEYARCWLAQHWALIR